MEKVGFIGGYDKTEIMMYVGKILTELGKKVLILDTTKKQKTKYIVPAINPTVSYITEFENIDIAVGFNNFETVSAYLGTTESQLDYDYALIDIDNVTAIGKTGLGITDGIYFATGFDLYSLKRGIEIKVDGNVDMFYAIKYGDVRIKELKELTQIFEPNSAVLDANSENLLDTFKNIIYSINASAPVSVTTENGRLDVSDLTTSEERPAIITVNSKSTGALIKQITITDPAVSNGLIIIEGDKMYLSVEQLVKECGLASAKDLEVTIEYYVEEQ